MHAVAGTKLAALASNASRSAEAIARDASARVASDQHRRDLAREDGPGGAAPKEQAQPPAPAVKAAQPAELSASDVSALRSSYKVKGVRGGA